MKISEKPFPQIINQETHEQLRNNPQLFKDLSKEIRSNREVVIALFRDRINVVKYVDSSLKKDRKVVKAALESFPDLGGSRSFIEKAVAIDLDLIRFAKTTLLDHPTCVRQLITNHPALADKFSQEFIEDPRFQTIRVQALMRHNTAPSPIQPVRKLRKSLRLRRAEVATALAE